MSAACLIEMEADRLLADGAFGRHRVKPLPSKQLYEFNDPDG